MEFRDSRLRINSGSTFEEEIGYSRAVAERGWVFVSGTTGFDYSTMTIDDDIAAQAERSLLNIQDALRHAGSSLHEVVRVRYIVTRAEEFPACWPVLRKYLGTAKPAATMFVAGLMDPRMKIEIEVTARRP